MKQVTGSIVNHPYMGVSFKYFTVISGRACSEYVNVTNGKEYQGKDVIATIENGRATVIKLDPESENNGE